MNFLFTKFIPVILNPVTLVFIFYYIKVTRDSLLPEAVANNVKNGILIYLSAVVGSSIFSQTFGEMLSDSGIETYAWQYYYQAYYWAWGLIMALGIYKILGAVFLNKENSPT